MLIYGEKVCQEPDFQVACIRSAVAYTSLLTDYVIAHTNESAVILAQQASPDVNVLNGRLFGATDKEKNGGSYDDNMMTRNVSFAFWF